MAPVQLPPLPSQDFGPFPRGPNEPPTVADFTSAREYEESVLDSLRRNPSAQGKIALQQANHYHWLLHENLARHQPGRGREDEIDLVIQRTLDAAMTRFEATLQDRVHAIINNVLDPKLDTIESEIRKLQKDTKKVEKLVTNMSQTLTTLSCHVYKEYNLTCLDGDRKPYKIIPFSDGTLPTDPPHNLPPLYSKDDILRLSRDHAVTYYTNYRLEGVRGRGNDYVARLRKAIAKHIGCPQDLDEDVE